MSKAKICDHCGAAMTRPPRMARPMWEKRRWCNRQCMAAARTPAERVCERCGGKFRPPFNRKRGHKFCSILCGNVGRPIKGPYRKMREGSRVRTVHRVVKERELGHPLSVKEVVHHRDENKQNNDPKNLEIMGNSEHSRKHMKGNQNARRSQQ